MRWLLGLWFLPISILVGWLVFASHDISFGVYFLSRHFYDLVFGIYAHTLGMPPEELPALVVRALILDSALVLGLFALRRRKAVMAGIGWAYSKLTPFSRAAKSESLSSAP